MVDWMQSRIHMQFSISYWPPYLFLYVNIPILDIPLI